MMDLKEPAIDAIKALPDYPSLEEIINAIYIKAKAIAGMQEIENGNFISTKDLRNEVESWK